MKKIITIAMMLMAFFTMASAQKQADIRFDKVTVDLGTFSEKDPVQKTTFVFTNVGDGPLVINQAVASCGCTVPSWSKEPLMPGQSASIRVKYNTANAGPINKSITVESNATTNRVILKIKGKVIDTPATK